MSLQHIETQLSILTIAKLDETLKWYQKDKNPHRIVKWLREFEQARANFPENKGCVDLVTIGNKIDISGFDSLYVQEMLSLRKGGNINQEKLYENALKSKENMANYIISFALDDIFRDKRYTALYPEEKKLSDLLALYDTMPVAKKHKYFGENPADICMACKHHQELSL